MRYSPPSLTISKSGALDSETPVIGLKLVAGTTFTQGRHVAGASV